MGMHQADMVETPLVSVVMPVYNASRFLRQAIESVLGQTYRNIELIVVDDCSKDDSLQILREYEARDDRVKVITGQENMGVAHVRNRGIELAQGKYIALLDSDDVWVKEKLERQVELLTSANAAIAYCSVDFIDEEDKRIKSFIVPQTTDYKEMLVRCYFICSTVVIDAELLKAHPFRTDFYHEDFLLWTELLALGVKAIGEPAVLALYRQIEGSRSNNKIHAAKHRWLIYRKALGMSTWHSLKAFIGYALGGIVKYYM